MVESAIEVEDEEDEGEDNEDDEEDEDEEEREDNKDNEKEKGRAAHYTGCIKDLKAEERKGELMEGRLSDQCSLGSC